MTIKSHGGIFGRNPTFNNVDAASLTLSGGNSLDRYQEGTWVPDPQDSSGNSGSATTAAGYYTRIGNLVFVNFLLENIDTTGLSTGQDFRIYGLPFTSAALTGPQNYMGGMRMTNVTFSGSVGLSIYDSTNYIRINENNSGSGFDYVIVSQIASGTADITGSITYMAE